MSERDEPNGDLMLLESLVNIEHQTATLLYINYVENAICNAMR